MSAEEQKIQASSKCIIYASMTSLQSRDNNTLSILSYNTLYKDWVTNERYPYIKNEQFRSWQYRLPRIRETISKYKADIVCLQEIDIDPTTFNKDFGEYFKNKLCYSNVLGPCVAIKQKKRESDGHWGNAVLYNSKRFKLIHTECLKKSSREMLLLFTDINAMRNCCQCDVNSSICCIYHSFIVVNVHLPGHPNRWRSRLNAIQRILNKLKLFGAKYKTKKVEKKTLKINTNINGNMNNIPIIICGDFNAPKTGNIDRLLLNKCIDINHYNITYNIYEEKQAKTNIETDVKKIVRFAVDSIHTGAILGKNGANITRLREESKAGIWICEAAKGTYGLKGKKIISIKGEMNIIIQTIHSIMDIINEDKIILFMEKDNLVITKDIENKCNVKLLISPKTLPYSTEQTVEIIGQINDIKLAIQMIMESLFCQDIKCINTQKCYDPQIELDANYSHNFEFEDSYNCGLLGMNNTCDLYYDRLKYFPTYGDGKAFGAMDFIYYTCNNIQLIGITNTLNDNELVANIYNEMDQIKKKCDKIENKYKKQQSELSNVLQLPNDKLVSDHLPICAVFYVPNMCHINNKNREKCQCFVEQKVDRLRNKINKNKKKKKKKKETRNNVNRNQNEWVWHQIHSF